MKKVFLLTLTLLLTTFSFLHAQLLDHVQGEILVQLKQGVSAKAWLHHNAEMKDFKLDRQISKPMNIYRLTFDFATSNEQKMLRKVWRELPVINAQFNHFISERLEPNDPQFPDQWQYINNGQDGGTVGADIDADLAWDVTTGGLTPDGDTIVVCAIDGGYDLNHPDMVDNYWVNHAEIPDNGVDDDNNGFVDDYYGWSVSNQSDEITQVPGHGTPVAGIIGAKGNNNIGVAGVNWDVKVMLVTYGNTQESNVIEAYSYPLTARKKYNETNGDEGAFVVSTNASWGVDFGQPDNSPIWCAFYDTLGVHGILNCGATINGNQNVDEVGDLPTACPSDHLISVTNMNRNDIKVTGAGYGVETIDLGAFGAQTWTVAAGGNYSGFGGTSGATPHVAGTIGLLYSAPCPSLIALAKSNPEEAVTLVKQYILEGVDPNASLEGITVTGGRLNINNSMQLLMNNCGDCFVNYGGNEIATDIQATLQWVSADSIQNSDLRWRIAGTDEWTLVEDINSPYTLEGLAACADYEYQIKGNCSTDESTDFGETVAFKTDGCCENPASVALGTIENQTTTISWPAVLAAEQYNIRYRVVETADWSTTMTTETSITLENLAECSDYEVEISINCEAGVTTDYTHNTTFRTKGCGACTDLTYCEMPDASTQYEWIAGVALADFENTSDGENSYTDFTGLEGIEVQQGGTYTITLTPGFSGSSYNETFRVWIDYDQNEEFSDSEEVYLAEAQTEANSGDITIPQDALLGVTRMRVVMSYNTVPSACSFNSPEGEAEDYCVTITEGMECAPTTGLDTLSVGETIAALTWEAGSDVEGYIVRYRQTTSTDWLSANATSNTIELTDLTDCVIYEAQVATDCGVNESDYSESITFTTDCMVNTEDIFVQYGLNVYPNPVNDQLFLSWTNVSNAAQWQVEIRDIKGQLIATQNTNNHEQVIVPMSNISQGVYLVQVKNQDGVTIGRQRIVKM